MSTTNVSRYVIAKVVPTFQVSRCKHSGGPCRSSRLYSLIIAAMTSFRVCRLVLPSVHIFHQDGVIPVFHYLLSFDMGSSSNSTSNQWHFTAFSRPTLCKNQQQQEDALIRHRISLSSITQQWQASNSYRQYLRDNLLHFALHSNSMAILDVPLDIMLSTLLTLSMIYFPSDILALS